MSIAAWSLFAGMLLITMVLAGTRLASLPLSTAMIYLGLGYILGPGGTGVIVLSPFYHAGILEWVTEVAVIISLFAVGLTLGIPMRDRRWMLPLRLAFLSMAMTVGLIALIGVWMLDLSPGAAVLLGGILAPTDPVLASGVQSESGATPDRVRFSLAGEGALNDGSAFPFVLLGLGLMGLHPLGAGAWHWWAIDLAWATIGGLLIGAMVGALIGKLVVHLRTRHKHAVGLDEFLSLGLIAISYGIAQLCLASGFLAVFAAGLALSRVRDWPLAGTVSHYLAGEGDVSGRERDNWATHSHHASSAMTRSVRGFNQQMEKLAELAMVLIVGAMLHYVSGSATLWGFIIVLLCVVRPLAVLLGMIGKSVSGYEYVMIGWFGIRGIGSIFYLMYALNHGVTGALAQALVSVTLLTVAISILVHGVSVRPLMQWYKIQKIAAAEHSTPI